MVLPTGQVKAEVSMLKHWQLPADGHKWELKWPLVGDFQAIVVVMKMKDVNIYYRQDFLGEYHTHAQAWEITHSEVVWEQSELNG